jgi:mannose-1-phosphate guanylyltransferase
LETVIPSLERAPKELTIHQSIEAELLGTAGGLKKVECHFASEDAFLLLNADTLVDFDLDAMMRVHQDSGALATLLLRPKPSRSPYSTVRVEADGQIDSIAPSGSDGEWMFAGVWILSPKILERLSVAPGGLEKELLPGLIAERAAYACPQKPNWITIDTPRRYWGACLTMARERLFEDDWNVELLADYESANVWVGAGTRIEEGVEFHGDVVLGAGCRVARGARIERTICWDRVEVPQGARLESCVITEGVRLRPEMELTDRLVMRVAGDDSELRKREIRDELLIATLKSERTRGL